jgi:hypothetical protein
MSLIQVYRPDVPEPPAPQFALAPRRELPEAPVIGLIPNGKPLAKELLGVLARELSAALGRPCTLTWLEKPAASAVISAEEATAMAVRAHIVISGLGD